MQGVKKRYNPRQLVQQNKKGEVVGDEEEIKSIWLQHFENLLGDQPDEDRKDNESNTEDSNKEQEEEEIPSKKEVEEIINNLKNNKSPGKDGIYNETIKYGGTLLSE